jgi:hypothetical protein
MLTMAVKNTPGYRRFATNQRLARPNLPLQRSRAKQLSGRFGGRVEYLLLGQRAFIGPDFVDLPVPWDPRRIGRAVRPIELVGY